MEQLSRGQRLPAAAFAPGGAFHIGLACQGLAVGFACFGLDQHGKLVDERYMTFFNQPASPCGGVKVAALAGDAAAFAIDTHRLPPLTSSW
jgi:stress response protein SCP2